MNPHHVCHCKMVYQIENNSTVKREGERAREKEKEIEIT